MSLNIDPALLTPQVQVVEQAAAATPGQQGPICIPTVAIQGAAQVGGWVRGDWDVRGQRATAEYTGPVFS